MKRLLLSIVILTFTLAATAQNKKVAILETVDKEDNVPYAVEIMVRSSLTKAISQTQGYEGYDRVDMSQIMGEQNFQRTGMVNDAQIKRLGELSGADYILVSEAVKFDEKNIYVTAKILNVETAKTEISDNVLMGTSAQEIQKGCETLSKNLFGVKTETKEQQQKPTVTPVAQTPIKNNQITENKKKYYLNGEVMDKGEYLEFIQSTCPQAYDYYRKGTKQRNIGWILAGAGYGVSVIGTIATQNVTFSIVGIAIGASSIPFFIMGCTKRNTSHEVYNKSCAGKSTASLSFGPTSNGLGVSLNF